ncbi:MAG TPA: hypothetical protein VMW24_17610 [Sedimentisphaerales bacterium]|nr:hypothetical protein [Sedimentisphaerales bacterium]
MIMIIANQYHIINHAAGRESISFGDDLALGAAAPIFAGDIMTVNTKTKSGNTVRLTPGSILCSPSVHCEAIHPTAGKIVVDGKWTCYQGRHGIGGYGLIKGKTTYILLEVPEADYTTIIEAARKDQADKAQADYQAALDACPEDYIPCRRNWANGDLCTAEYATRDGITVLASDLITNHNGWFWLPAEKVEAARRELAEKIIAKAEVDNAEASRRTNLIATANETGERQVWRSWVTGECTENLPDCSFDRETEWIYPDGSTKTTHSHCH